MAVTTNKQLDLDLLRQQLATAGITVGALGKAGLLVHTYDEAGLPVDLPPAAQSVVDTHDYQQGAAYQHEIADRDALTAFQVNWLLGQARLQGAAAGSIQSQMDAIQALTNAQALTGANIKTLSEAVEDLSRQLYAAKRTIAGLVQVPDR